MGLWFWCSLFDCANFQFWRFTCYWVHLLKIYLVGLFLLVSPVGNPLVIPHQLSPSEVLHGLSEALIGKILFRFFDWFTCWSFFAYAYSIGTPRGSACEVSFTKLPDKDLNEYLCEFISVTSGLIGAGFFTAWIKFCASWMVAYVDDIFGILNFLRKNYTVSEIRSDLVSDIYALCHL